MSFEASCPACGSPVRFDVSSSVVSVCKSCSTLVGRGDGALEDLGKVADLVDTDSPLKIGLHGKYRGVEFEIAGRTQLRHAAGGVWDEWYVAFRGGRKWGWLAEAQGRVYLTFPRDLPSNHNIPDFDSLNVEMDVVIPGVGTLVVADVGTATVISAEGEMPVAPVPGQPLRFADLSGQSGRFATIDYTSSAPSVFTGGEVTYEKMGIAEAVASREDEATRVSSAQINCPKCGGTLDLQAPNETQRVACPFCGSLLDCDHGDLKFLKALGKKKIEPVIPLGAVGTIPGEMFGKRSVGDQEMKVIGFMQRKVRYEGKDYPWTEYLLYKPRRPFCWLIHSSGHWSFGVPIPPGSVKAGARTAFHDGRTFRIYERGKPVVSYVLGEFYWKVSVGEKVSSEDYISPPLMLSREITLGRDADSPRGEAPRAADATHTEASIFENIASRAAEYRFGEREPARRGAPQQREAPDPKREVNYTVSRYFPTEQVEKAFGVENLRKPGSVAPNQPYRHKKVYLVAAAMLGLAMLLGVISLASSGKQVYSKSFQADWPSPRDVASESVTLAGGRNVAIQVSPYTSVYVNGELYNEQAKKVTKFGVQSGKTVYLSSLPGGRYTMKLKAEWTPRNRGVVTIAKSAAPGTLNASKKSPSFAVTVRQGVGRSSHFVILIIVLLILPVCVAIHHFTFEVRRWAESDFSPYSSE